MATLWADGRGSTVFTRRRHNFPSPSAFQESVPAAANVDLVGKKGHVRTVPMPAWTKAAIDSWAVAAGLTSAPMFRGKNKGDLVTPVGEAMDTRFAS